MKCEITYTHIQQDIYNAWTLSFKSQTMFKIYTHHPVKEIYWAPTLLFLNICGRSPWNPTSFCSLQPQRDTMITSRSLWDSGLALWANWRGSGLEAKLRCHRLVSETKSDQKNRVMWQSSKVELSMSHAFFVKRHIKRETVNYMHLMVHIAVSIQLVVHVRATKTCWFILKCLWFDIFFASFIILPSFHILYIPHGTLWFCGFMGAF